MIRTFRGPQVCVRNWEIGAAGVRPIEVLRIADREDLVAHGQPRLFRHGADQGVRGVHGTLTSARSMPSGAIHRTSPGWGGWPSSLTRNCPALVRGGLGGGGGREIGIDDVTVGDDHRLSVADAENDARADAGAEPAVCVSMSTLARNARLMCGGRFSMRPGRARNR